MQVSKKLLAKQWLSLQEAAELLTIRTGEHFTLNDVIHFICEKKIKVCWNLHLAKGLEVAPMSKMLPDFSGLFKHPQGAGPHEPDLNFDPINLLSQDPERISYEWVTTFGSVNNKEGPDTRLHGLYNLDLEINEGIGAYLRSYLIGSHDPVVCTDGFFVSDDAGAHYQILDELDVPDQTHWETKLTNELASIEDERKRRALFEKEKEKLIQRIANSYLPQHHKNKAIQNFIEKFENIKFGDFEDRQYRPPTYYPADRKPELDELAIRPRALEDFLAALNPDGTKDIDLAPKTRNMYLKLIFALIDYATDGLTGESSVDAKACLTALKSKGIKTPIGERALTNYIEEARNLR